MITPKQMVDGVNERFGRHPGHRALHAKGTLCEGSFTATAEAASLTRAAHMQGEPVPVLARFSNGSGNPTDPDYAPDVRGFAVSFRPPGGEATDIVSQTAPRFSVHTPDAFLELVRANAEGPSRLWKFPLFLARHPGVLASLPTNLAALKPPPSYASCRYYAIHAYKWVNGADEGRYVRYTWLPTDEEPGISLKEAKRRGRDYLQEELAQRLDRGPLRLELELQLADDGDEVDDPVVAWPSERQRVIAGALEVTAIVEEEGVLVFDPVRITDGIELSQDPILHYRPGAYSESVERRMS